MHVYIRSSSIDIVGEVTVGKSFDIRRILVMQNSTVSMQWFPLETLSINSNLNV